MTFTRIRAAVVIDFDGPQEQKEAGRVYGRLDRDLGEHATVLFCLKATGVRRVIVVCDDINTAVAVRPEVERLAEAHR